MRDLESPAISLSPVSNQADHAAPTAETPADTITVRLQKIQSPERLQALYETNLLDSPPEDAFDRLTAIACSLLGAPVSLVSLVDKDRQFFKSQQGLLEPASTERETPLSHSFCKHIIATNEPLIVNDARAHPIVCDNPAIQDLGVEAYLGIPLSTPDGSPIGSFCVIDHQPRTWSARDIEILSELADIVMKEIALRHHLRESEVVQARLREREATLQSLNEKLEARVAERTANLTRANRVLEQRNRELQDFAYVASHDLQEPLRKIQAFSNLLQDEYEGKLDENGTLYLDRMSRAAARMSRLINDLLVYSRISTHTHPFEQVSLGTVVNHILADVEQDAEKTEARFDVERLPTLEANGSQIYQLLHSLIDNALKFRKPGVPPRIHIAAQMDPPDGPAHEQCCEIQVTDNGIGIDEKYLDRIFTPFQRLHGRSAYEGTGMGLALCRRIAERHNGTITVRSTPGEGSTFIVTLPVAQV